MTATKPEAPPPSGKMLIFDHTDWSATQVGRDVVVSDRETGNEIGRLTAPPEWSDRWAWQVSEDGRSIEVSYL